MKKLVSLILLALLVSGCAVSDRKNMLALPIGSFGAGAEWLAADTPLPREKESLHQATYRSLEGGADEQAAQWKSTDTDGSAPITPVRCFVGRKGQP